MDPWIDRESKIKEKTRQGEVVTTVPCEDNTHIGKEGGEEGRKAGTGQQASNGGRNE
jgi:hypothetical protein